MTKKIDTDPKKTIQFDPDKCSLLLDNLIKVFQSDKFKTGEIIVAYGNLGYTLGAAIEGYKDKGPNIEELGRKYQEKPTVGTALMMQGIEVTNWFQDYEEETVKQIETTKTIKED